MADQPRTLTTEQTYKIDGTNAPRSIVSVGTVRFSGPTGLVGTAFGIPGMSATRVATGQYRVHAPRAPALSQRFFAQVAVPTGFQSPTGAGFDVVLGDKAPASGTIDVWTVKGGPTGAVAGAKLPVNPSHLSEVDLFVFTTPIAEY